MQNCVANIAGVVAPALTGLLVQRTGHFSAALTLAAAMTAIGALAWVFGVRSSDEPDPLRDIVLIEAL
jgi:dipeptide/tripeptide permease